MPTSDSGAPNIAQEESITTGDVVWGVSAVTYLWGGMVAWVLRSIPECIEQANTCGKVATAALVINLVSLAIKQRMGK